MTLFTPDDNLPPTIDPNKNYLEELVGENRKFKTPEDMARGKYEADLYIDFKNREFDALKADYLALKQEQETAGKLQEIYDLLKTQQAPQGSPPLQPESPRTTQDPDEMRNLMRNFLSEYESEKRVTDNTTKVENKLKETFGTNYKAILNQRLNTIGLSPKMAEQLAATSPEAFYKAIELERAPESFDPPPRSNQRSDGFTPNNQKRTWSYYQKLKESKPALYLDQKTQTQMLRDMAELGDAFKDGDWSNS